MAQKSKLKEIVEKLVAKKKYPKKDGGILTVSTDEGDVIILRSNNKYTYEFVAQERMVSVNIDDGKMVEKAVSNPTSPKAPAAGPAKLGKSTPKKETVDDGEPIMVEQKGYDGKIEEVDFRTYSNIITCQCGETRYVRNGDVHEVTMCKPCARKERRRRHRKSRKERGKVVNKPMPQTVVDTLNKRKAAKGQPPIKGTPTK